MTALSSEQPVKAVKLAVLAQCLQLRQTEVLSAFCMALTQVAMTVHTPALAWYGILAAICSEPHLKGAPTERASRLRLLPAGRHIVYCTVLVRVVEMHIIH